MIVTDFLTSMVVFHESSSGIPKVSYHTALEVFALFNSSIILMVMLEYLILLSRGNIMNEVGGVHSFFIRIPNFFLSLNILKNFSFLSLRLILNYS